MVYSLFLRQPRDRAGRPGPARNSFERRRKILSRFKAEKIAWAEKKIKENGTWTVMAGMLAPPPFPTKLIVLAAGFCG